MAGSFESSQPNSSTLGTMSIAVRSARSRSVRLRSDRSCAGSPHRRTHASTGSNAPFALLATASTVHAPNTPTIHSNAMRGASASRARPCTQASSPSSVNVAGSIASRCTMYSVVDTNNGCSTHSPAPSSGGAVARARIVGEAARRGRAAARTAARH